MLGLCGWSGAAVPEARTKPHRRTIRLNSKRPCALSVEPGASDTRTTLGELRYAAKIVLSPLLQAGCWSPVCDTGTNAEADAIQEVVTAGYKACGWRLLQADWRLRANQCRIRRRKLASGNQTRPPRQGAILTGLCRQGGARQESARVRHGRRLLGHQHRRGNRLQARRRAEQSLGGDGRRPSARHGHRRTSAWPRQRRARAHASGERSGAAARSRNRSKNRRNRKSSRHNQDLTDLLKNASIQFTRGPDGRISGMQFDAAKVTAHGRLIAFQPRDVQMRPAPAWPISSSALPFRGYSTPAQRGIPDESSGHTRNHSICRNGKPARAPIRPQPRRSVAPRSVRARLATSRSASAISRLSGSTFTRRTSAEE